jgi:hypothetical protein
MKLPLPFALSLSLVAVACTGSTGPSGPTGPKGSQGPPGSSGGGGTASISAVIPDHAFVERTIDVTLSGYATSWTDTTTIDFGPGITVSKVHAASPTSLVAEIAIDKTAAVGPRDVIVNASTGKETYASAFTVDLPMTFTFAGTAAQGSLAFIDLQVNDLTTPLDTTSESGLEGTTYTNLVLNLPDGVTMQEITSAADYSMQALVSIDVDAKPGTYDVDLISGPAGASTDVDFPVPKGLTIASRTATPLTSGTSVNGNVKTAYASTLYSFAPSSSSATVVSLNASSSGAGDPIFALLPKSGHFSDLISYGSSYTTVTTSTDAFYAVYWDDSGDTGPYSMLATGAAPAAQAAASAGDGTEAGAVPATMFPFLLTGGNLTTSTSADWVMVTTGAGDGGKTLTAQTLGDPNTDVEVLIYDSNGSLDPALDDEDDGGNVSAQTTVTASSVYYVVFQSGYLDWSSADTTYEGLLTVQ